MENKGITGTGFALGVFNEDVERAIQNLVGFHNEYKETNCLEMEESFRMTDEEAVAIIKEKYRVSSSLQLKDFEKEKRDRFYFFINRVKYRCLSKTRSRVGGARSLRSHSLPSCL